MTGLLSVAGWVVAFLVAAVGIFGAFLTERYKAHRAMRACAAVLHAEISALSEITTSNNTIANFEQIAVALEAGHLIAFPKIYVPDPDYGPVFKGMIDNLGFLSCADAEDVIRFYNYLIGIRTMLRSLVNGAWDTDPHTSAVMASQIRIGLKFWHECEQINMRLLPSLRERAQRPFRVL
jgi:hypothetical protein